MTRGQQLELGVIVVAGLLGLAAFLIQMVSQ